MGFEVNIFRILADLSHTTSKCILIWAIHANSSAEGVSLITQILYAVVFCTRYMDLFWSHPFAHHTHAFISLWNFFLKLFYIASSLYILAIMMRMYARTHERERAWRFGGICFVGSLLAAPFVMLAMTAKPSWSFWEFLWTFSIILESVCVLPQLLLLRQTTVPTVIDSFYLVTLGSYRLFYIFNWIYRGAQHERLSLIAVVFGVIQTLLYADFAWVYWSRQRVKLRNGALVDGDDWRRGWLVGKILGRAAGPPPPGPADDVEGGGGGGGGGGPRPRTDDAGWGRRGISVSADDEPPMPRGRDAKKGTIGGRSEPGARPEESARILHDSDDDASELDEPVGAGGRTGKTNGAAPRDVGNGAEWREGGS